MIPSKGLARVSPGLVFQNQILSRAPVRSIPRQAISRHVLSSQRQFGTSLRSNGKPLPCPSATSFLSGSRIGAASILASQPIVLSNRRFASTQSTTATSSAAHTTPSEFSPNTDFSSFTDFDAPSILNVPEHVGYLANLGLDYGHGPTSLCQWVVEHLHVTAGLPWWGAIVGAALAIRAVMAYPALIAQHESHKSQEMRKDPVHEAVHQKFMKLMVAGSHSDPAELMQLRMQMKYIKEQHGVKTYRMFLPMLQIPLAIGMFKLTRGMANLPVPGLESAGTLWFTDLTVMDPQYILPCVGSVFMYLSVKSTIPYVTQEQASLMKILPWILGPISIAVTLSFPAAVQLYFAAAAILQYAQTSLFHIPFVRKLCGLPPLEMTVINPQDQSPVNPFANRQGTYQAPRTVNTTATEHKPEEQKGFQNPISMFGNAKKQMQDTVKSYMKDPAQVEREEAQELQKRRLKEENEKYWARKEDAKWRQAQRKKAGKK